MSIFGSNSSIVRRFGTLTRSRQISGTLLAVHSLNFKEHTEAKPLFLESPSHPPGYGGGSPRETVRGRGRRFPPSPAVAPNSEEENRIASLPQAPTPAHTPEPLGPSLPPRMASWSAPRKLVQLR